MFFKKKQKPQQNVEWTLKQMEELQKVMEANPPESDAYKAAQASWEGFAKTLGWNSEENPVKTGFINSLFRVGEGIVLTVVCTATESFGFLVPTHSLQNVNLIERFTHKKD